MSSSNSFDQQSDEYYDCEDSPSNQSDKSEQIDSLDNCFEYEGSVEELCQHLNETQKSLIENLKLFLSELSSNEIFDLIEQIYQIKIQSNQIKNSIDFIQEKQHSQNQSNQMTNGSENHHNSSLQHYFDSIGKDLHQLEIQIEQLNYSYQKTKSQNPIISSDDNISQTSIPNIQLNNVNNSSEQSQTSILNNKSKKKRNYFIDLVENTKNHFKSESDHTQTLSYLLLKQLSPAVLDSNHSDNLSLSEDEQETTPRISQKIRLSNNIVQWLKGPFKIMVEGTMHAVDLCAQGTHINENVLEAVKRGLENGNGSFVDITSDWIFQEFNSDRGFTSPSIWMKDPQGKRVLIKTQEHPLCAANEWIAYALGEFLGLSVNQVQIGIYKNELVTVHTDVAKDKEKTLTFMDLSKQMQKCLLADPRLESMDIFDHIIQNVDRNPRNILITIKDNLNINEININKLKIHLIDHSSSFGMGKLNGISVIASKFHSNHLSVVKFNPTDQANKFEQYLSKLPINDRDLVKDILNRFASIQNQQFDYWITQIQDLLSSSQYHRIYHVLYQQRDITRKFITLWGIQTDQSSNTEHLITNF